MPEPLGPMMQRVSPGHNSRSTSRKAQLPEQVQPLVGPEVEAPQFHEQVFGELQPGLFMQLAPGRVHRRLVRLLHALGKVPQVVAGDMAQQDLAGAVDDDCAAGHRQVVPAAEIQ